jgi:hypothetical protein
MAVVGSLIALLVAIGFGGVVVRGGGQPAGLPWLSGAMNDCEAQKTPDTLHLVVPMLSAASDDAHWSHSLNDIKTPPCCGSDTLDGWQTSPRRRLDHEFCRDERQRRLQVGAVGRHQEVLVAGGADPGIREFSSRPSESENEWVRHSFTARVPCYWVNATSGIDPNARRRLIRQTQDEAVGVVRHADPQRRCPVAKRIGSVEIGGRRRIGHQRAAGIISLEGLERCR